MQHFLIFDQISCLMLQFHTKLSRYPKSVHTITQTDLIYHRKTKLKKTSLIFLLRGIEFHEGRKTCNLRYSRCEMSKWKCFERADFQMNEKMFIKSA